MKKQYQELEKLIEKRFDLLGFFGVSAVYGSARCAVHDQPIFNVSMSVCLNGDIGVYYCCATQEFYCISAVKENIARSGGLI